MAFDVAQRQARLSSNAFGGLSLPLLTAEAPAAHFACICLTLGPVISTLAALPGRTAVLLHAMMKDAGNSQLEWATALRDCRQQAVEPSFTSDDLKFLESVHKKPYEKSAGLSLTDDPSDPQIMIPDIPEISQIAVDQESYSHVQSIACAARRASEYITLFRELQDPSLRPSSLRLLSVSGRGSSSFLVSDVQSTYDVRAPQYMVMVCRVLGLRPDGWSELTACSSCGLHVSSIQKAMLPSEPVPETLAPEPTPPEQDADDDVDPPEDPDDIPDDPMYPCCRGLPRTPAARPQARGCAPGPRAQLPLQGG